jgi:hypothetical protein
MPRVPTYDNLQTQVAPQPNVAVQAPQGPQAGAIAAEQQGQMGRSLSQFGGEIGRIAIQEQDKADQVRVSDAMNKIMAAKLKLTYDPTEGYVQKRGQAALDPDAEGNSLDTVYDGKLKSVIDSVSQSLGNDRQRAIFSQQANQVSQQFNAGISSHVGKEYADHAVSVQQGTTKLAQDQMGIAWGDIDAVNQSRDAIKAATAEEGKLRGWSAATVEATTREQLSKGHEAVVLGALQAGKTEYATTYLKQMDAELTDTARLRLTAHAKEVDTAVRGDQAADEAWAKFAPEDANAPVRIYDMEQSIREQYKGDPKLQKTALESLKTRAATFNAQQSELNAGATNKIYGMVDSGMPLSKVRATPAWMALPEAKRHDIIKGLESEAATRASRGASDAQRSLANMQRQDRLAVLNNAGDYLHDSDPDVLASATREQVASLRTKYGFEGTQQLLAKWDTLQNKDARLTAKLDDSTFKAVVKDTLDIDPYARGLSSESKAMLGNLKNRVDVMLQSRAQELRRPLTTEEKTDLFKSEAAKTVTVDGWIWNNDKTAMTLTPKEAAKVVIPPERKAKLVADMQAAYAKTGDPDFAPTQENLARIYLKGVSPLSGLPNAPKQ